MLKKYYCAVFIILLALAALAGLLWQHHATKGLTGKYANSYEADTQRLLSVPADLPLTPLYEDAATPLLNQFEGKSVLINIWASWCAPCIKEIPQLIKIAAQDANIVLVLLSVDQKREDAIQFLETHKDSMTYNIITAWDYDRFISSNHFKTNRYPETVTINGQGVVTGKIIGLVDWEDPDVTKFIQSLQTL